ncbi:hypothetical protein [Oceanibacterium hippocampi]|uniref:Bacterial pre-peptidase C-terminal domain protein n=1 Tax=Oceanibacterium hippocampi TaxID=745714 RepID=A0A1Y5S7U5_9PROT|nr:hypothetical protein [Oceanibacterium hippocampi]SLN34117.1 hypothetical protein OCH7691_01330 [Oceanibacterium hippocampi]
MRQAGRNGTTWRRRGLALALAASVAVIALRGGDAAASDVALSDNRGVRNYLATVERLAGDARRYDAPLGDGRAELAIDGRDSAFSFANDGDRDDGLAGAGLGLYGLYQMLGGEPVDATLYFRREGERYYVGLDRVGGRWFDSFEDAQGYMLKLLIGRSGQVPPAVRDAVAATASNSFAALLGAASTAIVASRRFLARGATTTMLLSGAEIGADGRTPTVLAPPGVEVLSVRLLGEGRIAVDVRIGDGAPEGPITLRVFPADHSFTAAAEYEVHVVGSGRPPVEKAADPETETPASARSIAIGEPVRGEIAGAGQSGLYAVVVEQTGRLSLTTEGATDVTLSLVSEGGEVLARDDDGGAWYNAALTSEPLQPGIYYVRVEHCCAGTGAFELKSSFRLEEAATN